MPKDLELYKTKMNEKYNKNLSNASDNHISKKGQKSNMEGIKINKENYDNLLKIHNQKKKKIMIK